ncbi:hypothetical protein SLEP1_g18323 [Rubroshorea leprosula]|uniref:Protein arginine N-methyltransferase domain-containing protein n=1 Tax=Rubroshorea leprosula TaxID=152421 RepID=A0AAV5J2M0_9ROSI|nr:hypothetical protein SLEP1_g18323 [Rubroshorea leprosula]
MELYVKGASLQVGNITLILMFVVQGRRGNPARQEIELTTASSVDNGTHWGQQVFFLHPSVQVSEGSDINISFSMNGSKENHRLMEVEFGCDIRHSSGKMHPLIKKRFYIE